MPITSHNHQRPFRFGVGLTASDSRRDWVDKCRKAEELGYDVLAVADHLGMPAPFPAMVAAAEATSRVRLATSVLNSAFYNPSLLARDAATADQLTDGRLELGLGAGYVKAELDEAGLPWPSPRERVAHLARTVTTLRRHFTSPDHQPRPAQSAGPPLWLAGRGDRVLTLAAREADIIGLSGFESRRDGRIGKLDTAEEISERVDFVRDVLGERAADVELNLLVWRVVLTPNRRAEARRLEPMRSLTADQLLQVPTVLIGSANQIAEQLLELRDKTGFSYIVVSEYNLPELAPVIELLK